MEDSLNPEKKSVVFYEKASGFEKILEVRALPVKGQANQQHYSIHLVQNRLFPSELVVANSDFSLQLLDL